jgi:hypothetical protein
VKPYSLIVHPITNVGLQLYSESENSTSIGESVPDPVPDPAAEVEEVLSEELVRFGELKGEVGAELGLRRGEVGVRGLALKLGEVGLNVAELGVPVPEPEPERDPVPELVLVFDRNPLPAEEGGEVEPSGDLESLDSEL